MIISDLYTTESTMNCGETSNQFTDELTGNLRLKTGISADAYGLGWIRPENLPAWMRIGELVKTGDYTYTAREITASENCMCGYMINNASSDAVSTVIYNGEYANTNQYTAPVFINQLHPEYYGLYHSSGQSFGCQFQYYVYDAGGTLAASSYMGNNWTPAIFSSIEKFIEFIDDKTTASYNFGSTFGTISITADDLKTGTCYVETSTGYNVRLFLTGYFLIGNWYRYNGGSNSNMKFDFFAVVHDSDDNEYINTTSIPGFTGIDTRIASASSNNAEPVYSDMSTRFRPACTGTVNTQFITEQNPYVYDGTLLAAYNYGGVAFCPIFTIDDIRRAIALQFRLLIDPNTISYKTGRSYATNVTAAEEFTAEWKTGNIANPTFKNALRPWQYTDFQSNDFDPDNIPPYVPPGPGPGPRPEPVDPGDDETGGDDYEPNNPAGLGSGFGFVTQYAIRAAHLTDLGSKLWEGFFSEDEPGGIFQYMNNFIFAVNTDTGSVNFSDIMNFFISLRAYPCPISAMASTSAGGQDLYVGSGSKPIHLNTTFSIVNDLIGNIDAGERSVPYWFGDYRDYSLECIVYLPYCGTIQLNPGDIMGGTLSVNYTVDFCSGACVAYVLCTTWEGKLLRVGSLQGQLGADVPMTATNAGQVAARMYGDRIDAAETFTGALKSVISGGTSVAGGNYGGAVSAGFGAFIDPALQQERLRANMGSRGAISAPMLSAGRGLSGFADSKTVFLQIRSPIYAEPDNYDDVVGMPSTSAVRIGDCSGFCQFINVDVSGITTDLDDQQTIRRALESGIII